MPQTVCKQGQRDDTQQQRWLWDESSKPKKNEDNNEKLEKEIGHQTVHKQISV